MGKIKPALNHNETQEILNCMHMLYNMLNNTVVSYEVHNARLHVFS